MFGPEEHPFLAEILADPFHQDPRLVYADWLEEQGDVRLAAVRKGAEIVRRQAGMFDDLIDTQLDRFQRQDRNLAVDFSSAARRKLPKVKGITYRRFEGGVVDTIRVDDTKAFQDHAKEILNVVPAISYEADPEYPNLKTLLSSPEMSRLGALMLGDNYGGPDIARAVADSPHLTGLKYLAIFSAEIGDVGAANFAGAEHLKNLEILDLNNNKLTSEGITTLVQSEHLSNLQGLLLSFNAPDANFPQLLVDSSFQKLQILDMRVGKERPDAEAFGKLLASGKLDQIRWLDLRSCQLPSEVLQELFRRCRKLSHVRLDNNQVDEVLLERMAADPLPALRSLHLELETTPSDAVCERLAQASWLSNIEELNLDGCPAALARGLAAASLERLENLTISPAADDTDAHDDIVAQLGANASLARLQVLKLYLGMSPAALPALAERKSLIALKLPRNVFAEAKALQAALPDCLIEERSVLD